MKNRYIKSMLLVALGLAIVSPVVAQTTLVQKTKTYGSKALSVVNKNKIAIISAAAIAVIAGLGYRYYAKESEKAALVQTGLSQAQDLNLSPDAIKVVKRIIPEVVERSDGSNTLALFEQAVSERWGRLEMTPSVHDELENKATAQNIADVINVISAKYKKERL